MNTDFYVTDSHGPVIIGLPSCRDLHLVMLRCAINAQPKRVNTNEDLTVGFPNRFDKIGDFRYPFHIVKDPHIPSVIHGNRHCPIQLKEGVKRELDSMEQLGVIHKVTQPTDWVNSIAHGRLRICLDPKDLNKAIKRCHYRAATIEEVCHKLVDTKFLSKLDARLGYWSVHLNGESQLLTTFNIPIWQVLLHTHALKPHDFSGCLPVAHGSDTWALPGHN